MRNKGWTHQWTDNWYGGSVRTRGNHIERSLNHNVFSDLSQAAGDSRVRLTGIEVRGTAPGGTFLKVTGGKSQGSQRSLYSNNGLQNLFNPSDLFLLSNTDLVPSPLDPNYFEFRSSPIAGLNLIPSLNVYRPSVGARLALGL